ncbi:hypothetical protein [Tahibacter caeni]|uniref:hypothetical protein n=1 Tax=Tahibacter caeni TaxID=1453545 RepID=UPI0021479BB8|nr:hypothetical protein [Tahibacter caeni]
MQCIRSALRRWLSASAFAVTLLFAGGARAESTDPGLPELAAPVDDSLSTVGQYYPILCNTCVSTSDYINKAVTQYPRVRQSVAFVYNLTNGQIRSIALDWNSELYFQAGGYEVPTAQRLIDYMRTVSDLYRRNGNSLSFTTIIRADGSVYLKFPSGATVELRAGSPRTIPSSMDPTVNAMKSPEPVVNEQVTPGRGSPIDLRGYNFGPYFGNVYPNYPATSYDLAFSDQPGSIDAFVYDYFSTLGQTPGFIFDPDSMANIDGASRLTQQVTGQVTVFVPMKDGGYAKVRYDTSSGDVMLRQVVDPSGIVLPTGYGNALQFYADRSWFLGSNAAVAVQSFEDWAARYGIDVLVLNAGWGSGGRVTCISRSVTEVTCTIQPN